MKLEGVVTITGPQMRAARSSNFAAATLANYSATIHGWKDKLNRELYADSSGLIYVRPHVRKGRPIAAHWRKRVKV